MESRVGTGAMHPAYKHGLSKHPLYFIWNNIVHNCKQINKSRVWDARKIIVCDEWQEFPSFYEWAMENGYKEGLVLKRINFDGDFCPGNCGFKEKKTNGRRIKI